MPLDVLVQAARAAAPRDDIPDRDAPPPKQGQPLAVRSSSARAEELVHDVPERVVRMRVVFPLGQRGLPGHRAHDKDPRAPIRHRRKRAETPPGFFLAAIPAHGALLSRRAFHVTPRVPHALHRAGVQVPLFLTRPDPLKRRKVRLA